MAEFTAFNLPKPSEINYPTSNSGSTASGIAGGLLNAVGNIGDKVLTHLKENDAADAGKAVSDKLTSLVQENFGATKSTTPLVGEDEQDASKAAANASPVVQATMGQLGRLSSANKQGALSPSELFTRGSVIVQDAINQNPMFAGEIRQAAQAVLGTQPTQELVKLAEQDASQSKALAAEVKHSQVMSAANAGIAYVKADGTMDFDKMQTAGQQLQFSEKQMADALKLAQLQAAAAGPKATHDEQIASETQPFIKSANPVFEKVMDGMMSSVPATIAKLANQSKPQQVAAVLQAVGTQQAQMNNWVNTMILKNNLSPDAAAQLRTYYNAPFESIKGLASSGDFSYFATNAAALKAMNDSGTMHFLDSAPAVAKLHFAGGDQAVATMLNLFKGVNTPFRMGVDHDLNGYFSAATPQAVLSNGANALAGGGYQLHNEQNPDIQSKTLKGLVGTLNAYTARPDSLTDTEKKAFGNATLQITNLGLQSNDPRNLASAASVVNSPNTLAAFDAFVKDPKNADKTPVIAQGMISLNTKSVMRNIPVLMQGSTAQVVTPHNVAPWAAFSGMSYLNEQGQDPTIAVKAVPHFNPVSGKVDVSYEGSQNGKSVTLSPDTIVQAANQMGDYHRQLASVNQSLNAIAHLAPSGVGREKDFSPLEIKQLLTSGAGLPVKSGMKPVPMPKFMTGGPEDTSGGTFNLPKHVADAQIKQESGGKNGIVSPQGAVGVAQIRPANFPQYNAEKLKNDPEYALKARDEIMSDLLHKYNGNVALALAEYHGGPNQKLWGPKTFQYVSAIMSNSEGK